MRWLELLIKGQQIKWIIGKHEWHISVENSIIADGKIDDDIRHLAIDAKKELQGKIAALYYKLENL